MKTPAIRRVRRGEARDGAERGVTIVLVALAMVAIMAMAAMSIDVVTLYLANAEAQRAADAAALAAARILSISGITGDPNNSAGRWTDACALATPVAQAVAAQNTMGGISLSSTPQVVVTYPNSGDPTTCTGFSPAFGVNPIVTVKVQRTDMPTFFARIWGRRGASVSATATAEAFNPSNSSSIAPGGTLIPVQPRCVKPWIVPNIDPGLAAAGGTTPALVNPNGTIAAPGIRLNNVGVGIVGERFNLFAGCPAAGACSPAMAPGANVLFATSGVNPPNLTYFPGEVDGTPKAASSCATGTFQTAIAGCDQTTAYQCGVNSATAGTPNRVNLTENPGGALGDTALGAQCLISQAAGQDTLDSLNFPYKMRAGAGNPLISAGLASNAIVTSSNSIVSLPIYDGVPIATTSQAVTIVGFLQVFINQVNADVPASVDVTVLNVVGCGNGTTAPANPVIGSSPVPVRLVTYP
jgi:Flp pilus assembly protein TadG